MWSATEPRTAVILAPSGAQVKTISGVIESCICRKMIKSDYRAGLVRGERWVSGTKNRTRVDEKSADFEKNSRLMVDRLTEIKNQEQQIRQGGGVKSDRGAA